MHRRFDNFIHILLQTTFTVHGWSHEWELKQITFEGGTRVQHWQYFEGICCGTRNIYGFNPLDTVSTSTISDVYTAGTACCTRGFVLLIILPVLAVFGPSVLVLLTLPVRAVFRAPHTRVCDTLSTSSIQSIEPRNSANTGSPRNKASNTIHTNILYHATASCTDTPTYRSSINSSIWSTAVVLLLCIK